MSWKPSIPSPRPSTYRKYSCTRRRRTVQVSGLTTHTPMPTHFTSRRQLRPAVSSAWTSSEPTCSCSPLEMLWPVLTNSMGL
ncbi:hypothetical protein INR49_000649 [Caranx melampygus]|nr:hypothetical protein INR49_000649 [Caranx melampygus]